MVWRRKWPFMTLLLLLLPIAEGREWYTPTFFGSDSFTYDIEDGNAGVDSATVTVTVTPVNDPPMINAPSTVPQTRLDPWWRSGR